MAKTTYNLFDIGWNLDAAVEVLKLKNKIQNLSKSRVLEQVVMQGYGITKRSFESALAWPQYDKEPVEVSYMPIPDGFCILAEGEQASFVEFGAGVWVNPGEREEILYIPSWVVDWGEYGLGNGKRKEWQTPYGPTNGIPARMGMYQALKAMDASLVKALKMEFDADK